MTEIAYGTWPSPIAPADLAGASTRLSDPRLDGGSRYWVEGRASEGGRRVLVRLEGHGTPADLTGESFDVGTRVHEYGGAAYTVHEGVIVASRAQDGRLCRLDGAGEPLPLTPAGQARYADPQIDSLRGLVYVICEDHSAGAAEPANTLVAVPLDGTGAQQPGAIRTVWTGSDFVSSPRLSPDGAHLAFITWEHPNMPWDVTSLRVARLAADGGAAAVVDVVTAAEQVAATEPLWAGEDLIHADDRTGWWNLYRTEAPGTGHARTRHLHPAPADFSAPAWSLGTRTFGLLDSEHLVATWSHEGHRHLGALDLANGELEPLATDWEPQVEVAAAGGRVLALAEHPLQPAAVVELEPGSDTFRELARSSSMRLDPADISHAEAMTWAVPDDADPEAEAHGFLYAPVNGGAHGLAGELAPLVVMLHGGPTGATSPGFSPTVQFWTTRGFAVLDVDYRGSSGYGRAYRQALQGQWGLRDVADCAAGAEHLSATGRVDGTRMVIRGGSAGGFTVLAALAFTDVFAAGTSRYGIGDLAALAADTHKFESRYTDGLVGPYPEQAEIYAERSPAFHVEQITAPLLLLQGTEDAVVPQAQAEQMRDSLQAQGRQVEMELFPGEGHGFRGAQSIARALELELDFYRSTLGLG